MPDPYFLIDQKRWARRTMSWARMRRMDRRPIPRAPGELRLFVVLRDEMLRLPYFFQYYRAMGVQRFIVVDNASSDGSLAYLLDQPDTHVFETAETYTRQEAWIDALVRRFGAGHWCVVLDVDELLVLPGPDAGDLRGACARLAAAGADALYALLLDMYPRGPLDEAAYRAGEPFAPAAPCFEHASIRREPYAFRRCDAPFPYRHAGGVRERVFGVKDICLTKFPLVRFHRGLFLRQGTHAVEGARIAREQAVLLHFKYLNDFTARVQYEAERGEHWNGASQYKAYASKVRQEGALALDGPDTLAYEGPAQLRELGLLKG